MKKSSINLLLCFTFAGLFSCQKPKPRDDSQQKIQAVVDKYRKKLSDSLGFSFPSLSLIIQTPTDKFFVTSTGDGGQVVTPDTYYRFASNTKPFTATAILNMYEDGWLDYKAKITDLVPGTKFPYVPATPGWDFPYKNEITIRQLLQHVAGVFDVDNEPVPGYNGLTYTEAMLKIDPLHQFTTSEMVEVVTRIDSSYGRPGQVYHYSNTGYSILAEIIKRVYTFKTGKAQTYADYLEDYIIGSKTRVPLPTIHFPTLATDQAMPNPHIGSTILEKTGPERYDAVNMSAQLGEGNGYGTMEELHKFIRTLSKGENVLKPSTVKLMQTDVSMANPEYGLGSSHTRNLGYGHNGARLGSLNLMGYDPDHDVSFVAMIPLYDLRNTPHSFAICISTLQDAVYAAREALGFPGKP
ncbi:MAG TPA: serine hydrolase domain-containing protein [Chitinophagaceae bacterium]|nr:serine hydrolase domain-containing protein [Chitinophagaceae bacterium]